MPWHRHSHKAVCALLAALIMVLTVQPGPVRAQAAPAAAPFRLFPAAPTRSVASVAAAARKRPVLFVPGFGTTFLYKKALLGDWIIWLTASQVMGQLPRHLVPWPSDFDQLKLDIHGNDTSEILVGKVMLEGESGIEGVRIHDVYKSFYDRMRNDFGYTEADGSLTMVGYDFRRDPDYNARTYLAPAVEAALARTGADKVILVAHSYGGLVSRTYIANTGGAKVAGFVTMGTPYLGAGLMVKALTSGWDFGIPLLRDQWSLELAPTWPATKYLMPAEGFYEKGYTNGFLRQDGRAPGKKPGAVNSIKEQYDWLKSWGDWEYFQAQAWRGRVLNGSDFGVANFTIVGTGFGTVALVKRTGVRKEGWGTWWEAKEELEAWDGDGIVPLFSANLLGTPADFIGPTTLSEFREAHSVLPNNRDVQNRIKELLDELQTRPVIEQVWPSSGRRRGGEKVFIYGKDLQHIRQVEFGRGNRAQIVNRQSNVVEVIAPPPPGTAGIGPQVVFLSGATGPAATHDKSVYTYVHTPAPTLLSVTPAGGLKSGGTQVTIVGQNLEETTAVYFGRNNPSPNWRSNWDGSIVAKAPPMPDSCVVSTYDICAVPVLVATRDGGLSEDRFRALTFQYAAPGWGPASVAEITPSSAKPGDTVTMRGSHFVNVTQVAFGPYSVPDFTVDELANTITAKVPKGRGTHLVVVSNEHPDYPISMSGGSKASFTFDVYTPVFAGPLSQRAARPGAEVSIKGKLPADGDTASFWFECGAGCGRAYLGSEPIWPDGSYLFTFRLPARAVPGPATITIQCKTCRDEQLRGLTVRSAGVPVVTALSPDTAPHAGGIKVKITGRNFFGAANVYFGNKTAEFTVDSEEQITATLPASNTTLPALVGVNFGLADRLDPHDMQPFTYRTGHPPQFSGLGSQFGPLAGGNTFGIIGDHLDTAQAVYFGDVPAPGFRADGATWLAVTAPPGQRTGKVQVRVVTLGGEVDSGSSNYEYRAPPTVSSLRPSAGPTAGGTSVVITGTDFDLASAVRFGDQAAERFTVDALGQITAVAPPGSGSVPVTVTTPTGTAMAAVTYAYGGTDESVRTTTGPFAPAQAAPGERVALSGTSVPGSTVRANFYCFTDCGETQLGSAPVDAAGRYTLTFNVPTGATLGAAWVQVSCGKDCNDTWQAIYGLQILPPVKPPGPEPPRVTRITPDRGRRATGVTITGTGLSDITEIRFGNTPVDIFLPKSDTEVVTVVPAGAGAVNVTIRSPAGTSPPVSFTIEEVTPLPDTPDKPDQKQPPPPLVPVAVAAQFSPGSAAPGESVTLSGQAKPDSYVSVYFYCGSSCGTTHAGVARVDAGGKFSLTFRVPDHAVVGTAHVQAGCDGCGNLWTRIEGLMVRAKPVTPPVPPVRPVPPDPPPRLVIDGVDCADPEIPGLWKRAVGCPVGGTAPPVSPPPVSPPPVSPPPVSPPRRIIGGIDCDDPEIPRLWKSSVGCFETGSASPQLPEQSPQPVPGNDSTPILQTPPPAAAPPEPALSPPQLQPVIIGGINCSDPEIPRLWKVAVGCPSRP